MSSAGDKICFCNNISRAQISAALEAGAVALQDIYDKTGAGVGPCGGSCRDTISAMIQEKDAPASSLPSSWLPPLALVEGISLFNRRYYWECHEVLEHLWMDEVGPVRLFYQGLIQAAAALYHVLNANPRGVVRLALEAKSKLEQFLPAYQSIPLSGLVEGLASYAEQARECLGGSRSGFDYEALPRITIGTKMDLSSRKDI